MGMMSSETNAPNRASGLHHNVRRVRVGLVFSVFIGTWFGFGREDRREFKLGLVNASVRGSDRGRWAQCLRRRSFLFGSEVSAFDAKNVSTNGCFCTMERSQSRILSCAIQPEKTFEQEATHLENCVRATIRGVVRWGLLGPLFGRKSLSNQVIRRSGPFKFTSCPSVPTA